MKLATELRRLLNKQMKNRGLKMAKKISSGGFFGNDVYDERKAYSLKELAELSKEGFLVDENIGFFIFNAFNTNN